MSRGRCMYECLVWGRETTDELAQDRRRFCEWYEKQPHRGEGAVNRQSAWPAWQEATRLSRLRRAQGAE